MSPVSWVEVANSTDAFLVELKPVIAPWAIGDTPPTPVMLDCGTVLTPDLARMARLKAVPRSTAAGLTNVTAA
jgi:hypothetical protein